MNQLQNIILMITEDIINICKKNNIPYYMVGGTQLGASRHNGFIPWDDDLDLALKRKDYEKLLEVLEKDLDKNKYFVQNEFTEKGYAFSFSKIQLLGTEFIEDFSKNVNIHHCIFIDIFPYDNLPDNKIKRKLFLIKNNILKNRIWIKCGYGCDYHKKRLSYKILKFINNFTTLEKLYKKRYTYLTKYNNQETKFCFPTDYPKQILKNEWFKNSKSFNFENIKLNGFANDEEYLKSVFGNTYMQLPSIEKRKSHTKYEVNFGKYVKEHNSN